MSTRLTSSISRCIRAMQMRVVFFKRIDVVTLAFLASPLPSTKEMLIVAAPAEFVTDDQGETTDAVGQGLGV
ncbi:MAG: hypothetical protein JXQ99_29810 [Hyphomicrobiaceae bacterium]